jgi:hypothetical protein
MESRQAEIAMTNAKAAKTSSLYGVHPGVAVVQKWVAELKEKTEHSLEEPDRHGGLAKKDRTTHRVEITTVKQISTTKPGRFMRITRLESMD